MLGGIAELSKCCCVMEDEAPAGDPRRAVASGAQELLPTASDLLMMQYHRDGFPTGVLARPPEFSVRSVGSAYSSGSRSCANLSDESKAQELVKLQLMVKDFVRGALRGVPQRLVLEDGSLLRCDFRMDCKLSSFSLQVRDIGRTVVLTDVKEICSGREISKVGALTVPSDLCVALVLVDDQYVSFQFEDAEARERFATCMKVLRLARD